MQSQQKSAYISLNSYSSIQFVGRIAALLLMLAFLLEPVALVYANEGAEESAEPDVSEVTEPEQAEEESVEEEMEPEPEKVEEEDEVGGQVEEGNESSPSDEEDIIDEAESADTEDVVGTETDELSEEAAPDVQSAATTTDEGVDEVVVLEDKLDEVSTSTDSSEIEQGTTTDSEAGEEVATSTDSGSGSASSSDESDEVINDQDEFDETATTTNDATEVDDTEVVESNEDTTHEKATTTDDGTDKVASTTPEVTEIASTTPPVPQEAATSSVSTVINAENKYRFAEDECVTVGDGSFYCSKEAAPEVIEEDRVFAAVDEEGDREIYLEQGGELFTVTDNLYDDAAPYYDEFSGRIVWHSLREGRFQVVTYDTETGEETLLTNERYNNMEPTAYNDATLWQAWIGNNWEIMLHENGTTTRLTENDVHDVAPHMRSGYVVWQSETADGWQVQVYDIETKVIESIEGDGSLIENPRFVLVYDSTDENGDVRTMGYDLDNKETIPLAALPRPVPEDIPEPDSSGEERALIQAKPSGKDESDVDQIGGGDDPNITPDPDPLATSTDAVVIPVAATSTEAIPDIVIDESSASSTPDTTQASSTITDVVIPPFKTATTSEEIIESLNNAM